MRTMATRQHIDVNHSAPRTAGAQRASLLGSLIRANIQAYRELWAALGISPAQIAQTAERTLSVVDSWRPELITELDALAEAAAVSLQDIVSLNARTEVLSMARGFASKECSTFTTLLPRNRSRRVDTHTGSSSLLSPDERRLGVQTWDWHIEFADYWHTQVVTGQGYTVAGVTEAGILSKIGVNSAGLALHFNILGHHSDQPGGIPMHLLATVVLRECATVREAVELVRSCTIHSSSALTLVDAQEAVSLEISPIAIVEIPEVGGTVQRTNHFLSPELVAEQKHSLYEPDSTQRLELIRHRLQGSAPTSEVELVRLLESEAHEPPLSCRADMSLPFGERWATLATVITDPTERSIRVFDGSPVEARGTSPRVLSASGTVPAASRR